MPLPTGGAWPPPSEAPTLERMREHAAWYAGDTDALTKIYGGSGRTVRPSQMSGGIVGTLARWFWGSPPPAGERRVMLHIPLAADIATASSDLLFADPPNITFDDDSTQARFDELRDQIALDALLVEGAETGAALGGSYFRVGRDDTVSPDPIASAVWADQAIPEFRWGRLFAVTFWQELDGGQSGRVLRHLERHEPGRVLHGLYEGDPETLGSRIDLTRHPLTAPLARGANGDGAVPSGVDGRLAVVYVPNMRPNRRNRTAHGRSDYDGIEPTMDALDRSWSSWMRDVDLGKARIVVPNYMLQDLGPGKGAAWDFEREIYEGVNAPPSERWNPEVLQADIRVDAHSRTCRELIERAVSSAGYSLSSFGLHGEAVQATATEVEARKDRSNLTRDKKIRYWDQGITDLSELLLAMVGVQAQAKVEFAAAVQADQLKLAQTAQALRVAEAASTRTLVRMQHPDWEDTQVDEEVAEILGESGRMVEDPGTFTGLPPDVPPAAE